MLDSGDHRDSILVYCCKRFDELAYTNLIHHAQTQFGLKTVSTLTDLDNLPQDWAGYKGVIDVELILAEVPDYMDRLFYISGPHGLVEACKHVLSQLGVPDKNVRTDYFPGF
jgi:ferredoxin-NADP reductase